MLSKRRVAAMPGRLLAGLLLATWARPLAGQSYVMLKTEPSIAPAGASRRWIALLAFALAPLASAYDGPVVGPGSGGTCSVGCGNVGGICTDAGMRNVITATASAFIQLIDGLTFATATGFDECNAKQNGLAGWTSSSAPFVSSTACRYNTNVGATPTCGQTTFGDSQRLCWCLNMPSPPFPPWPPPSPPSPPSPPPRPPPPPSPPPPSPPPSPPPPSPPPSPVHFDAADLGRGFTLESDGKQLTHATNFWSSAYGTDSHTSGTVSWYVTVSHPGGRFVEIIIGCASRAAPRYTNTDFLYSGGNPDEQYGWYSGGGGAYGHGSIVGVHLNLDSSPRTVSFSLDGGDPILLSNQVPTGREWTLAVASYGTGSVTAWTGLPPPSPPPPSPPPSPPPPSSLTATGVASVASIASAGGGGGGPAADPVIGSSAATVSTGFSQTALGAIIGAILGLCLLCGVGAFLLYRRRKDVAFRKTLANAVDANTSGAAITAVAPPARRPARISGLQYVAVEI